MDWERSGRYSLRAAGRPYAVSMARAISRETGILAQRYSAWHGEPLEIGRRDVPFPELLGVMNSVADAKALCELHALGLLSTGGADEHLRAAD